MTNKIKHDGKIKHHKMLYGNKREKQNNASKHAKNQECPEDIKRSDPVKQRITTP